MNKTDIKGCRLTLEAKRKELLASRMDTAGIAIERVPDSIDGLSLEVEQSMAVDALDRKIALLRQVNEALERISAGNYGECLACQGPISPKRLAALPWAALCIGCQQVTEDERFAEAIPGAGLRLASNPSRHSAPPAGHFGGHASRMHRRGISQAPADGGAAESEARL